MTINHPPESPPVLRTLAGSECSAGAGAQADLKTFLHFGVHGLSAITCVVAETSREVGSVHPVPPEIVAEQISLLLSSFPVAAIKTGMLFSRAHIEAVAAAIGDHPAPLVVDPVMIASTGDPLIEDNAISAYRSLLFSRAAVITPNLDEATRLTGMRITTKKQMEQAGEWLFKEYGTPVVLKGGHLKTKECHDLLYEEEAHCWASSGRIGTQAGHGTGCTFAAALAACLARGKNLREAFCHSKTFILLALSQSFTWMDPDGRPIHALNQAPFEPREQ